MTRKNTVATKDYMKEYNKFIDDNLDKEMSAYLLKAFIKLGYIPVEPLEDFLEWYNKMINKHQFPTPEVLEYVIDDWVDYWGHPDNIKNLKNFKNRWNNSYKVKDWLRPEYKGHNTI